MTFKQFLKTPSKYGYTKETYLNIAKQIKPIKEFKHILFGMYGGWLNQYKPNELEIYNAQILIKDYVLQQINF